MALKIRNHGLKKPGQATCCQRPRCAGATNSLGEINVKRDWLTAAWRSQCVGPRSTKVSAREALISSSCSSPEGAAEHRRRSSGIFPGADRWCCGVSKIWIPAILPSGEPGLVWQWLHDVAGLDPINAQPNLNAKTLQCLASECGLPSATIVARGDDVANDAIIAVTGALPVRLDRWTVASLSLPGPTVASCRRAQVAGHARASSSGGLRSPTHPLQNLAEQANFPVQQLARLNQGCELLDAAVEPVLVDVGIGGKPPIRSIGFAAPCGSQTGGGNPFPCGSGTGMPSPLASGTARATDPVDVSLTVEGCRSLTPG